MSNAKSDMNIWGHLGELRKRVFRAVIGFLITTMVCFAFADKIIDYISIPIGGIQQLQSIEVTENMSVFMRVSLLSGFILAFPFILFQVLAFVMPGLTKKEQRWVKLSIPIAGVLYLAGAAFAFYVMVPAAVPFLVSFLGIPTTPRLANYMSFVTNMIFWIGLCFEFPLLAFVLAKINIITAKGLAKQWRIAIVAISVLAAVISPTVDPINMGILMAPLIVLYFISIIFAVIAKRNK